MRRLAVLTIAAVCLTLAACIPTVTATHTTTSGTGTGVTTPVHAVNGARLTITKSLPGTCAYALTVDNAQGPAILLGSITGPYDGTQQVNVSATGDYHLVVAPKMLAGTACKWTITTVVG